MPGAGGSLSYAQLLALVKTRIEMAASQPPPTPRASVPRRNVRRRHLHVRGSATAVRYQPARHLAGLRLGSH